MPDVGLLSKSETLPIRGTGISGSAWAPLAGPHHPGGAVSASQHGQPRCAEGWHRQGRRDRGKSAPRGCSSQSG